MLRAVLDPRKHRAWGANKAHTAFLGAFLGSSRTFLSHDLPFFFCLLFCFVYTLNLLSNVDLLSLVEILNLAKAEIYLVLLTMIVPYQPQCLAHRRDSETGYS